MPEIKFPEVRFPEFKLPEGLRDISREDIQKAMSDVKLPDMKMPDVKLPKRSDIAKSVEKALPTRPGPSPVPFAVLAMLGGLVVGWILATSPMTGPRISAAIDGVRQKIDDWRSGADGADDELDSEPDAFRDAFRSPSAATASNGGVGASHYSAPATDGTSVGAESVGSERL
ncbi:MAG: hypothetical protein M3R57_02785 [Chloroflexota bacterium]|nr:hypothetical protein [Chloroflexota bacterium]